MERHYILRKLYSPDFKNSITIRFEADERLILNILQIIFHDKNEISSSMKNSFMGIVVDKNHPKDIELVFPDRVEKYAYIELIVRDTTSKTQHKIEFPFDKEPIYTEMLFGS